MTGEQAGADDKILVRFSPEDAWVWELGWSWDCPCCRDGNQYGNWPEALAGALDHIKRYGQSTWHREYV